MTNDNNTAIDTTDVTTTPLNVAATHATVTTAGNITASTTAATTSTILPAGNAADETTRRSLFGAGLYQTVSQLLTYGCIPTSSAKSFSSGQALGGHKRCHYDGGNNGNGNGSSSNSVEVVGGSDCSYVDDERSSEQSATGDNRGFDLNLPADQVAVVIS
ncbi:hypothetical protein F2Q70_00019056 [Brassica cretica]|uniref:C2H2-type domain-containing protein n=1 Tax=Brassica cretica TaxID=69181 RepID=A0A8S9I4I5_BRACR|nr:hypothetical protein F2Q70_00019056 [Brassica cretica]